MRFSHKFIKIFISAFAAFFSFIGILTILDKIFSLDGKGFHGAVVLVIGLLSITLFFVFSRYLNSIFSNFIVTDSNKED
tara:strand:+ start:9485 stop:9721 length:237 start_codon:yes stop_codon:yes gene_type:complete